MYVVVGLGNPGPRYVGTRHNIGHDVVECLAQRASGTLSAHRQTRTHQLSVRAGYGPEAQRVILATLDTYMNTSGGPTAALLRYYDCPPENLIVIHDELDLPHGTLKLKRDGGEGGHNGLKSISQALGTKNYIRLRFGIGRPPGRQDPADYVLGRFSGAEKKDLGTLIEEAADAAEEVVRNGLETATLHLHTKHR
ncbi:aminoacyl-tRNA hydrolase [Actinobaculum suis]|uniref:aminoacyl-tRNA hydrolase n=1 Tax=Actinobaculum suis TaxID=1657 RepID=UPI00066FE6B4|nr:aminoacyl-tRNA hydrolase [Actinobaculum suis]KMY23881.1 peptidyl-tRNA hydrolase [Actinobaculum suis]OCA93105.1 aminoacyl-tRNA hydrolase [Actinobaculum suis]OCA93253.1 aminoacyl-tRNA hydrolase [Actinobaculum suis]